jgi:periplasmic divalent cation tolerance protein
MAEKIVVALSTFPDASIARRISNDLVSERFAACANILPGVESIYRWKEKIETGNEVLVLFKVSEEQRSAFQERLRSLHPYDIPEIIFLAVVSGLPEYLQWVSGNCGQAS